MVRGADGFVGGCAGKEHPLHSQRQGAVTQQCTHTHTHPGYKEVTLLGQNIDAYGRDLPGMAADASGRRAHTFTDLLHHVHDVPGIERIRFATSHPRYFTGARSRACLCACTAYALCMYWCERERARCCAARWTRKYSPPTHRNIVDTSAPPTFPTPQTAWCVRARSYPSCVNSSTSPSSPVTTTSCVL